ncbi:MAG: DUF3039 domain-containing protein [Acidimicrobiia bacterium]
MNASASQQQGATEVIVRPSDPDTERDDRVAHIAPADKITEAYITGAPIEALCGATFVPSRDPKGLPVCQKCKDQYEFLMVFRTNDKIKDDI